MSRSIFDSPPSAPNAAMSVSSRKTVENLEDLAKTSIIADAREIGRKHEMIAERNNDIK